jgi:POT family proton-dependent oligopeptide transporter
MSRTNTEELYGHPKGLYILFFVEMWERFSYYGMRALLTLYLVAPVLLGNPQGGLGWSNVESLSFYGTYTMFVYLTSIPGGWIADRFIGQKKAVMLGGVLLCIGHVILAVPYEWAFMTGLVFIVSGVGFLKPNISTMVGGLYGPDDDRRDGGFYIFYIGINLGAFLGALVRDGLPKNMDGIMDLDLQVLECVWVKSSMCSVLNISKELAILLENQNQKIKS